MASYRRRWKEKESIDANSTRLAAQSMVCANTTINTNPSHTPDRKTSYRHQLLRDVL